MHPHVGSLPGNQQMNCTSPSLSPGSFLAEWQSDTASGYCWDCAVKAGRSGGWAPSARGGQREHEGLVWSVFPLWTKQSLTLAYPKPCLITKQSQLSASPRMQSNSVATALVKILCSSFYLLMSLYEKAWWPNTILFLLTLFILFFFSPHNFFPGSVLQALVTLLHVICF